MRCIFIYNPVSGRGNIAKKLDRILRALGEKYDEVDSYATSARGDMTAAVRSAAAKYDAVIFSGGDGSFNEAVQGLCEAERMPEVGYIPSGTVNDVAHSLGIPKNLRRALKVITGGENVLLDCMKINDRYAMYIVAAGAFTSATYTTPQSEKQRIGRIAYAIEGIRKNLKFEVFPVRISDGVRSVESESVFVMLMNGRYVAGLPLNRRGSMADGKIEVALIRQRRDPNAVNKLRAYGALARLFLFGYRVKEKLIVRLEGSHFEIEAGEGVIWNFDGEKGISGKVTVDVLPSRINMIVPKKRARSARMRGGSDV